MVRQYIVEAIWLKHGPNNAENGYVQWVLQISDREVIDMASYKQAIQKKCKECIFDPDGGNGKWREQVEACTSSKCSLFQVRPRTRKVVGVRQ